MIRSMTGYSSLQRQLPDMWLGLDIKTLNHRSFDLRFHSARSMAMMEVPIRERLKAALHRGRVEVYLRGEAKFDSQVQIASNPNLARRYADAVLSIQEAVPEIASFPTDSLLNMPGVLEVTEPEIDTEEIRGPVLELLEDCLQQTLEMRRREGEHLNTELRRILGKIRELNAEIESHRSEILAAYREKLLERVEEWREEMSLDEHRVVQEVALLADRSDIREETARLDSHLDQFVAILDDGDGDTPAGRRLDFLCQEMFREVNTMGSKSQALDITQVALALKSRVDQLREQVQNVE